MLRLALLLTLAGLSAGCFLPVSTAAPQAARTVGKGQWGYSFSTEIPTLNLIANDSSQKPDDLVAPANSMDLGLQYGLTNHIDIEANAEGAMMAFVIPLPLGVSGGIRAHIIHNDVFDLGVAGRIGYLGLTSSDSGSSSTDSSDHADATYLAGSAALQFFPDARVRPSIAWQEMPAYIHVDLAGEDPRRYRGAASSLTISLEFVTDSASITPFLTVTSFDSPDVNSARFVSGGIQFQHRNNRPAPPVIVMPPPPPPPPQSTVR